MAEAVSTCVHCGFCLAACPTYAITGNETESPRGRIVLMKEVLQGDASFDDVGSSVDSCLGCLACQPACPSGVGYGELLTGFRRSVGGGERPWSRRLARWLALRTLPSRSRFAMAARTGRWVRPLAGWFPKPIAAMLSLVPDTLPKRRALPRHTPAHGKRIGDVTLLVGCAASVLEPEIHHATIEVLTHLGYDVHVPKGQGCCGGLAWHTGDATAKPLANDLVQALEPHPGFLVTNAAGCGSTIKEYPMLLAGTPLESRAKRLASRTRDVMQIVGGHELSGWRLQPDRMHGSLPSGRSIRVGYQSACHLRNAQGVVNEPMSALGQIEGIDTVAIEAAGCCGSAGIYNIEHPEMSEQLGQAFAKAIVDAKVDAVASGNIGCIVQLRHHLKKMGSAIPVLHTVQVIAASLPNPSPVAANSRET